MADRPAHDELTLISQSQLQRAFIEIQDQRALPAIHGEAAQRPSRSTCTAQGHDLCAAMRLATTAQSLEAQASGSPPGGAWKDMRVRQSAYSSARCPPDLMVSAQRPVVFWGSASLTGLGCMPSPMMLLNTMWACAPELRSARMSKWSGTVLKASLPDFWRCFVCVRLEA